MNELISVIVPIYNVAPYLEECCEAIANQTYKNIEIILIDDGSTDASGKICDEFAKKDSRARVIHKKNGGLSSSRNVGIDKARGELLSFIDSDDFPRTTMLEKLYECLLRNNADVACCDFSSRKEIIPREDKEEIFLQGEAISRLLDDYGYKCYAWNKLYRKSLFNNIKYPEGEFFEDIKTTFNIFSNAKKICYLQNDLYYYRIRQESITNRAYSDKNIDQIKAIDYVKTHALNILNDVQFARLSAGYIAYYMNFIKKAFVANKEIAENVDFLQTLLKKEIGNVLNCEGLITKIKIEMILFTISPNVFKKMLKLKNKRML